jgi:hypothetical protein
LDVRWRDWWYVTVWSEETANVGGIINIDSRKMNLRATGSRNNTRYDTYSRQPVKSLDFFIFVRIETLFSSSLPVKKYSYVISFFAWSVSLFCFVCNHHLALYCRILDRTLFVDIALEWMPPIPKIQRYEDVDEVECTSTTPVMSSLT